MRVPLVFGVLPVTIAFAIFPGLLVLQLGFWVSVRRRLLRTPIVCHARDHPASRLLLSPVWPKPRASEYACCRDVTTIGELRRG